MNEALMTQQAEAVRHLQEWRVGALFMEPGTGKTRVAVELVRGCQPDMVLWMGPLHTLPDVRKEIDRWGGLPGLVMVGVESISASDRIYLETRAAISGRCFCVVDESLKIKNSQAKRTRHILELGQLCEYRLILNGTPLSRNLCDLWAQMQFLSPKILGMTEAQFVRTFCCTTRVTNVIPGRRAPIIKEFITGYENIDYLYSLVRHYVYECDLHLQVRQLYRTERYSISDEERTEYQRLKEKYLDDEMLQLKNDNIFLEMTSKMQHSYCICQSKMEACHRCVTDEAKTIIFCRFIDSREACQREFPNARVLSYQKEAFGLNLQDYHTTIFFDKVWDYALRLQAGRRTFRTGQTMDCHYFDLTGNVGLENLIDRNIEKKVGMAEYFKRATINDLKRDL